MSSTTTKIELLKRVELLQLEIQKNKELLRDAIRKNEKFAEFNKKSIKIDNEERAIRKVELNSKEIINEKKIPIDYNKINKKVKESITNDQKSVKCYSNKNDDDKKFKSVEEQFLELISKCVFTSIDEVLSDHLVFNNSSVLHHTSKSILILCQNRTVQKIENQLNSNLNFVKMDRKSFKNEFGNRIKFGIVSIKICNLEPNSIEAADEIIFYQFNLIELWESIKKLNSYLQKIQKMYAIIDSRLMLFLTEFQKKIKVYYLK
ncbi:hypothetical protein [Candidatus Phytoplasma fabacearum]|uniref:hypothetical protein n=1 Tax=Candidatus Phytoplasma fabacearum TaxID=2982628 RepID=UPI002713C689|nr:hypothetical protein ['Bituminaria bituminosa' little leaf phytoplasma]MDO8030794.1 hypothetical protein ['Bituminaria bituminosa' little leaf phytoplasma]